MTPFQATVTTFARDMERLIRQLAMETVTQALAARASGKAGSRREDGAGATSGGRAVGRSGRRLGRPRKGEGRLVDRVGAWVAAHPGWTAARLSERLDYTASAVALAIKRNPGLFRLVPGKGRAKHIYAAEG